MLIKSKEEKKIINELTSKKIALLGLGLDNQAFLNWLREKKIKAEITICDKRDKSSLPEIKDIGQINYQLGSSFNKNLKNFDLLFRSPGWPLNCPGVLEAKKMKKTIITSSLNLFFRLCPSKNIIGVTGSKGKGTTASLIYKIISDAKKKVWLGGNIGVSPFSFLKKIKRSDYVVLELSSFQLEDLKYSPAYSVITNLFKEHLAPADPNNPNYHSSYNAYWQAKLQISKNSENKYLIINEKLKSKIVKSKLKNKIYFFKASPLPSKLIGDFNRENVGAAVALSKILKIKESNYKKTIARFLNLEHRLELAVIKNGVKYFDNSFSTTPESTILDLKSFREPIIQIAGGADKGANFLPLAKEIKKQVKHLILLSGEGTTRLKKELLSLNFPKEKLSEVDSMEKAIKIARLKSQIGDIVLLSTACASFGLFKNYKERGNLFKKYAQAI